MSIALTQDTWYPPASLADFPIRRLKRKSAPTARFASL